MIYFVTIEYAYNGKREKKTFKRKYNSSFDAVMYAVGELSGIDNSSEFEIINIYISQKV